MLAEWLTWRAVMFINVPLGLVALAFGAWHIAEPARHPARVDLPGAATATLGVGALVYGVIRAAEAGWGSLAAACWWWRSWCCPMLLMGIGGGLAVSPLNVVIMATVPPEDAGAAGGALQTMQQLGATLGLAILVRVAGSTSRGVTGSADEVLVAGMSTAFTAASGIALLTFAVALTFKRR